MFIPYVLRNIIWDRLQLPCMSNLDEGSRQCVLKFLTSWLSLLGFDICIEVSSKEEPRPDFSRWFEKWS